MRDSQWSRQVAAPAAATAPAPTAKDGRVQWTLTANSSQRDQTGYSDRERQLLEAGQWEHRETTDATRRALRVVTETTQLAQDTLGSLYQQGQQVERAAHGIEQICEDVKHAGRMVQFMRRFCCFRNSWNDPDLDQETQRPQTVQQQRMAGVVSAQQIAASYEAKQEVVSDAVARMQQAAAVKAAGGSSCAAGGSSSEVEPWSHLIAAVPGPLGAEQAQLRRSTTYALGQGLEDPDRRRLQAETAKQESNLDMICGALDQLQAMSLAMGAELEEQAPKLDELQQRAEETGAGLRSVAAGAAKLAGRAPNRRGSASSWSGSGGRDAATAAVSRAVAATAPLAARYAR